MNEYQVIVVGYDDEDDPRTVFQRRADWAADDGAEGAQEDSGGILFSEYEDGVKVLVRSVETDGAWEEFLVTQEVRPQYHAVKVNRGGRA